MPTYKVDILETVVHTVIVEADSPEIASDKAYYVVDERLINLFNTEFLGTYDSEITEMTAEEVEEYNAKLGI